QQPSRSRGQATLNAEQADRIAMLIKQSGGRMPRDIAQGVVRGDISLTEGVHATFGGGGAATLDQLRENIRKAQGATGAGVGTGGMQLAVPMGGEQFKFAGPTQQILTGQPGGPPQPVGPAVSAGSMTSSI